jgi:hypothetical protein
MYDPSPSRSAAGSPEESFKKEDPKSKTRKSADSDNIYEDDFDDMIEEDIPERDEDNLENSGDRIMAKQIGESHGITVS